MKIKFICNECNEEFNIMDEFLIKKDSVVCPNCSSKFDQESFKILKDGISSLSKCKKTLPSQDVNGSWCSLIDFKIID
jgi:DNA-directed RNA polymerase subunit RPC12/RpoP